MFTVAEVPRHIFPRQRYELFMEYGAMEKRKAFDALRSKLSRDKRSWVINEEMVQSYIRRKNK